MIQQGPSMWLSEAVFNWEPNIFQISATKSQTFFRAYELHQHAESLITNSTSELQLADGISNLKRALNQRLKFIDELYSVSTAFPKNFGFLECLHELGLAKPYVIKQLLEVRNNIEHNDASPPSQTRCVELLDITWYFLKSTDPICASRRESFDLGYGEKTSDDPQYFLSIDLEQHKGREIRFRGRLPHALISREKRLGFFQFTCEEIRTKAEQAERINLILDEDLKSIAKTKLWAWSDSDLVVTGMAVMQPELYKVVLKQLLTTSPTFR